MAPPGIDLDSAEALRRFKAAMLGEKESLVVEPSSNDPSPNDLQRSEGLLWSEPGTCPTSKASENVSKTCEGASLKDHRGTNGAANTASSCSPTTGRQLKTPEKESKWNSGREPQTSPLLQPQTSSYVQGIAPPVNTPQTRASSPRITTHNEDVGDALAIFVQNMEGRSLADSMWAPRNGKYQPPVPSKLRPESRNLTPVNESFSRMTFRIADSDVQDSSSLPKLSLEKTRSKSPQSDGSITRTQSTTLIEPQPQVVVNSDTDYSPLPLKTTKILPHMRGRINATYPSVRSQAKEPQDNMQAVNPQSPKESTAALEALHPGGTTQSTQLQLASKPQQKVASPSIVVKSKTVSEPIQDLLDHIAKVKCSGHLNTEDVARIQTIVLLREASGFLQIDSLSTDSAGDQANTGADFRVRAELDVKRDNGSKDPSFDGAGEDGSGEDIMKSHTSQGADVNTDDALSASSAAPITVSQAPHTSLPVKKTIDSTAGSISSKVAHTHVSMTPKRVQNATTATIASSKGLEDREHSLYFSSWGKQEVRAKPAARIRKVIINDLPFKATPKFVASIIYGGAIEEINMRTSTFGDLSASVRFVSADDCMDFYDKTANGIVYKKDAQDRDLVLFVELGKDVDVVGGLLQGWIDTGVTRVVRAVGVDEGFSQDDLRILAEGKGRKLEALQDYINPGGTRTVIFRFCKMAEAIEFRAALTRNDDWERCNIQFTTDPCASATGVHFD